MSNKNKQPSKGKKIYEGKAKILFEGPEAGTLIQHFKDDVTAFNNQKKGSISGKGVLNNRITEYIMNKLAYIGIPTHFIKTINMREQLIHAVDIIPLEVVVRNVAAGSFSKRFAIEEGQALSRPLVEFYLKNDELGDPLITENQIMEFDIVNTEELIYLQNCALRVNDFLSGIFSAVGIRLIDFKLEFGRKFDTEEESYVIVVADEISPDSCRLWDMTTNEKMDKDRFRRDLGNVEEAYQEVAKRLGLINSNELQS